MYTDIQSVSISHSCWFWVRVGGDFLSRLTSFVVSVWLGEKGAVEYYSSNKNAGLCRAGFGFPGHPVLNYSLKASAQLIEFVWIDWEAERVVAKTLELFVSLQFIQIKWPVSGTVRITDFIGFPVLIHSRSVSWCLHSISVYDISRLCFTCAIMSPLDPCTSGCGARPATAVLIRAQVSYSQHIRVRLQALQNKLHGGLKAKSREMCTVACLPNQTGKLYFRRSCKLYLYILINSPTG